MYTIDSRTIMVLAAELAGIFSKACENGGKNEVGTAIMDATKTMCKTAFCDTLKKMKEHVNEEDIDKLEAIMEAITSAKYLNDGANMLLLGRQICDAMDFMEEVMTYRTKSLASVKRLIGREHIEEEADDVMTNIISVSTYKDKHGNTKLIFETKQD